MHAFGFARDIHRMLLLGLLVASTACSHCKDPEPEDQPCKNCTVFRQDQKWRIAGRWVQLSPTPPDVDYPVPIVPKELLLRVELGVQKGQTFEVPSKSGGFRNGDLMDVELPSEATPNGWDAVTLEVRDQKNDLFKSKVKVEK